MKLLREVPTTIGRPRSRSSPRRRSSSRLCSTRLAEADPGVDPDPLLVDPRGGRELDPLGEERLDVVDDVVVARVVLHRPRVPSMCMSTTSQPRSAQSAGELGVAAQRGDVVDDRRAGVERRLGDRRLRGVDRDRHAARPRRAPRPPARPAPAPPRRRPPRPRAASTRRRRRGSSAPSAASSRPCAIAALGVEEQPAVRERVGRDVDDAHRAAASGGTYPSALSVASGSSARISAAPPAKPGRGLRRAGAGPRGRPTSRLGSGLGSLGALRPPRRRRRRPPPRLALEQRDELLGVDRLALEQDLRDPVELARGAR